MNASEAPQKSRFPCRNLPHPEIYYQSARPGRGRVFQRQFNTVRQDRRNFGPDTARQIRVFAPALLLLGCTVLFRFNPARKDEL